MTDVAGVRLVMVDMVEVYSGGGGGGGWTSHMETDNVHKSWWTRLDTCQNWLT